MQNLQSIIISISGKQCFKTLPPASVIKNLRDIIDPDYWYIFPDEIN